MGTTLRKLRSIITTELFKGIEPDDSKLNFKYYNQLIFDARAIVCKEMFMMQKSIDPAWFSTIPLQVIRDLNVAGVTYSAIIPSIIYLEADCSIHIRGGNDINSMNYIPKISRVRSTTSRTNIYSDKGPKVTRIGNQVVFHNVQQKIAAVAEAIVYDLMEIPNFTLDTNIPMCAEGSRLVQQKIQELDIKQLKDGAKDQKNNSVLSLQTSQKQEE
jgi:hypothetical protein